MKDHCLYIGQMFWLEQHENQTIGHNKKLCLPDQTGSITWWYSRNDLNCLLSWHSRAVQPQQAQRQDPKPASHTKRATSCPLQAAVCCWVWMWAGTDGNTSISRWHSELQILFHTSYNKEHLSVPLPRGCLVRNSYLGQHSLSANTILIDSK